MKLGRMIELAGGSKNDFDGARRREVLPFRPIGNYTSAADGVVGDFARHGPYTLMHAVLFKIYLDLARSGLVGKEAQAFSRTVLRGGRVPRGADRLNFLCDDGGDLWIAREVFTDSSFSDPRAVAETGEHFGVDYWAGTKGDIDQYIAQKNAREIEGERQTVSLQVYNVSGAVRVVRSKAAVLGMVEAHDKRPHTALNGRYDAA